MRNKRERTDSSDVRGVPESDWELALEDRQFLEDVERHRTDGVRKRYERLSLSAHKGNQTKNALVKKGLLEEAVIQMNTTRRSALRLTEHARNTVGTWPESNARNESVEHEFWKHWWKERMEACGHQAEIEASRVAGRVDVLATRDDYKIGIEVETGKSNIAANVVSCMLSGFDKVVVVATTKNAKLKAQRTLREYGFR